MSTEERTAESQKGRILEYKQFDLRKIKMNKKDAYIEHQVSGTEGGTFVMTDGQPPHPDLQKSLDGLKKIMARRLGLLEGTDVAREIAKGDLTKYETALNCEKEIINRCNVNGLTFTGSGDKYGVMITGSILLPKSGSVGLACSRITFGEDILGYEDETEELVEAVKKEAYAYRFQNKKAQTEMEFEAQKIEETQQSETKSNGETLEATVITETKKKGREKSRFDLTNEKRNRHRFRFLSFLNFSYETKNHQKLCCLWKSFQTIQDYRQILFF